MRDKIEESLGLPSTLPDTTNLIDITPAPISGEIVIASTGNDLDDDYNQARKNYQEVADKAKIAMDDMADLAKASQGPRHYEVLANLMKTYMQVSKDLVDMSASRQKRRDKKKIIEAEKSGTVNNNLFISTHDLQEMLEKIEQDKSSE